MQRRNLIWTGCVGLLAVLAACQSGTLTAKAESEPPAEKKAEVKTARSQRPIVAQRPVSASVVESDEVADVGFDVGQGDIAIDPVTGFAIAAFPPTIPDRDWHRDAWTKDNCLSCHETGVSDAPMIRHRGLPEITFASKCRSCHVLIPGKTEMVGRYEEESEFEDYAFPPMLPNNVNHAGAWNTENCMLCHENGVRGAPIIEHKTLPAITMKAKCRTCHVQVRSIDAEWMDR